MSNDLLFPIITRDGKVPSSADELRVQRVEKEAALRPLNDEEKSLNAEEREAREKYHQQQESKADSSKQDDKDANAEEENYEEMQSSGIEVDEKGRKHLDIYI